MIQDIAPYSYKVKSVKNSDKLSNSTSFDEEIDLSKLFNKIGTDSEIYIINVENSKFPSLFSPKSDQFIQSFYYQLIYRTYKEYYLVRVGSIENKVRIGLIFTEDSIDEGILNINDCSFDKTTILKNELNRTNEKVLFNIKRLHTIGKNIIINCKNKNIIFNNITYDFSNVSKNDTKYKTKYLKNKIMYQIINVQNGILKFPYIQNIY